jgi:biofilm PGA synthesis N-glycosyltransferase PgaC
MSHSTRANSAGITWEQGYGDACADEAFYDYVLVTAAYNEEANIGTTIDSMLSQHMLPKCWIIISDGSTDRTDEIVSAYLPQNAFMRFIKVARKSGRSFGAKVRALNCGVERLKPLAFTFIGNLDADVSVEPQYFKSLMDRFRQDPALGVAGGFVYEEKHGVFRNRKVNRAYSVAHAAQLVRRECYENIGGYAALAHGGEDWHAQTSARMLGWRAEAFPDLHIYHHRHTGEADNLLRHRFRQGRMDYSLGSDPLFETLKCLERMADKPIIAGGCARLAGFVWSAMCREERPVSDNFVRFLRSEQRGRLLTRLRFGEAQRIEKVSG